ncbi:MAG TPA: hypothetical protein VIX58_02465 [Anaerolineae bacterium]
MDAKILATRWLVIVAVTFVVAGALVLGAFGWLGTRQGDTETATRIIALGLALAGCLVVAAGLATILGRTEASTGGAIAKAVLTSMVLMPAPLLFIFITSVVNGDYGPASGAGELVTFWLFLVIPAAVGGALIALAARKVGLWVGVALALAFLAVVARLWLMFAFGI